MSKSNTILQNPYFSGVIGSLIASFLTFGFIELKKYIKHNIIQLKFKKIFGTYDEDKLNLVLPALRIRPDVIKQLRANNFPGADFPLFKYGDTAIRSSKLIAYADTTSLKYLLEKVSKALGDISIISTDEDLSRHLDLSFIAFGGSNFYCSTVINEPDNKYYHFDGDSIVSNSDTLKRFTNGEGFDYGFIIKYKHVNFPNRTWIVIAGIGETGTSGAGWYLANHWQKLSKLFGDKPFGIVIKVKDGVDESAIKVDQIV